MSRSADKSLPRHTEPRIRSSSTMNDAVAMEVTDDSDNEVVFVGFSPGGATRFFRTPSSSPQRSSLDTSLDLITQVERRASNTPGAPLEPVGEELPESACRKAPTLQILENERTQDKSHGLVLRLRRPTSITSQDMVEGTRPSSQQFRSDRSVSVKRKREEVQAKPPSEPRRVAPIRLRVTSGSSTDSKKPDPKTDGAIDYHYFVNKFFNRGR